jgi:hypothetical protein
MILRVDHHRSIAQHGLRPCGRHTDVPAFSLERVSNTPKVSLGLFEFDLEVAQGRTTPRAPVDDIVAAIDQPLLVEADEHLPDRPAQAAVHSEALSAPVAGGPHPLELLDDDAAVLLLPLPDLLDEVFSADGLLAQPALGKPALHHVLGGNARVVGARQPEYIGPAHALVADEDILQGHIERMPHMEGPCDVRRRDDD